MKKLIIILGILSLCFIHVAFAAPTSTVVQNLFITSLAGNGTKCVHILNSGLIQLATADCGSGVGGSSSINFYANSKFFVTTSTINFSAGSNITLTTSSDGTYTIAATGFITTSSLNFFANGQFFVNTSTIKFTAGSNITLTTSSDGTYTIAASASGGGSGTVTTSTPVTANYFPFWNATGGSGLNGTSSIFQSGLNILDGGSFNSSGTITQSGTAVVLQTRNVGTGQGLQGGGALSADLTLSINTSSALTWSGAQTYTGGIVIQGNTANFTNGANIAFNATPVTNAGGYWIGGIAQNITGTAVLGNVVQGGGVFTYTTTTNLTGTNFCQGGLIVVASTTATTTLTLPDMTTLASTTLTPCAPLIASTFAQQFLHNSSTNNVVQAVSGTNERIYYAPGTPSVLAPGQTWDIIGQMVNATNSIGSTATGSVLQVNVSLYQSSTITNALILANGVGGYMAYGGASACSAGQAVTTISVTGATTCATFLTSAPATSTYSAQSGSITTNALTIATSGPLLSATVSGQTLTLTTVATSTILTGYSTSTAASLAGKGLNPIGATLTVSSTVLSSTINLAIQNPTTTAPSYTMATYDYSRTFTNIGCVDAAGTTTLVFYTTTGITSVTQNSLIVNGTLPCGTSGNSTTTFTSSTLVANFGLLVQVTSTAGTPTQVRIYLQSTKL